MQILFFAFISDFCQFYEGKSVLRSQFLDDGLDLLVQFVAFCYEGFELGIDLGDIDHLAGVFLLHIAGDREVAVVGKDIVVLHQLGQILLVLTILVERHDLVLMLRQEDVLIAILLEELAGIDEEHTRIHLGTPLCLALKNVESKTTFKNGE